MAKTLKKRSPFLLYFFLFTLTCATAGLGALAYFRQNDLLHTWATLTDAQATIIGQAILIFGAAWAAVLVPMFFSERLRSLEDAAASAQETYQEIQTQLLKSAEESKLQLRNISRYQQMQLGFVANDNLLSMIEGAEAKKDFIDGAWEQIHPKITRAIAHLHGATQNSISQYNWRSTEWWDKIRVSGALRTYFDNFKCISDAKSSVSKGAEASLELLAKVNNALKNIDQFKPDQPSTLPTVQVAAEAPAMPAFSAPTIEQQQHPN